MLENTNSKYYNMVEIKKYNKWLSIKKFLPLFQEFYQHKDAKEISRSLKNMLRKHNYSLLVAFQDKKPVAIAGINYGELIYCGKFLRISNLYVIESSRNSGIAANLLQKAEEIAIKSSCKQIVLDSYIDNIEAHKIYHKEKYHIPAHHFTKNL